MTAILRFFGNFVIAAFWLWVFQAMGWISFLDNSMFWWQALLIVAAITKIVEFFVDLIFFVFLIATLGIGCVVLPIIMLLQGWIWLWGASELTGWFTINVDFWFLGLLMSVAYGLIRIPSISISASEK